MGKGSSDDLSPGGFSKPAHFAARESVASAEQCNRLWTNVLTWNISSTTQSSSLRRPQVHKTIMVATFNGQEASPGSASIVLAVTDDR
jgi:hypothetical protein